MTTRSVAIYHAKAAFAVMFMRGIMGPLQRIETEDGTRFSYTHPESGFVVILKHASDYRAIDGAVDATRTKAANAAPAAPAEIAPAAPAAPADDQHEPSTTTGPLVIGARPVFYFVSYRNADGTQYYVSVEDITRNACGCENWDCDCPDLPPTLMSYAEAQRVAAELNAQRDNAKTAESWDYSPHNVTINQY